MKGHVHSQGKIFEMLHWALLIVEILCGALANIFLNVINVHVFLLFRYHFFFDRGFVPSFEQTRISFTQSCFIPGLIAIGRLNWNRPSGLDEISVVVLEEI